MRRRGRRDATKDRRAEDSSRIARRFGKVRLTADDREVAALDLHGDGTRDAVLLTELFGEIHGLFAQ